MHEQLAVFIEEVHSVLFRAAQIWRKSIKTNISEAACTGCLPPSYARLLTLCFVALLISMERQRVESFYISSRAHSSNLALNFQKKKKRKKRKKEMLASFHHILLALYAHSAPLPVE